MAPTDDGFTILERSEEEEQFEDRIDPRDAFSSQLQDLSHLGVSSCETAKTWVVQINLAWCPLARSPSSALLPCHSPTRIEYRKKGALILTSLLEDLGCFQFPTATRLVSSWWLPAIRFLSL